MTVEQYIVKSGFRAACQGENAPVTGCYCGDLLSWVMGKAQEGHVWLTVMSNVNVAAVAALAGVACVVLCEGALPDEDLQKKAEAQQITLLLTDLPIFEAACLTQQLLL